MQGRRDGVDAVLGPIRRAGSAKGLEVSLKLDDGLPEMLLSAVIRLRQILMKLMGNGVDSTEARRGDMFDHRSMPVRAGDCAKSCAPSGRLRSRDERGG